MRHEVRFKKREEVRAKTTDEMSTDLEPKKEKEGRCSREQNGPFLALCILAESVASES